MDKDDMYDNLRGNGRVCPDIRACDDGRARRFSAAVYCCDGAGDSGPRSPSNA